MTEIKNRPDNWDNPYKEELDPIPCGIYSGIIPAIVRLQNASFEAGADALITAGYRPVPSVDKLTKEVVKLVVAGQKVLGLSEFIAEGIHQLLLEGDKE